MTQQIDEVSELTVQQFAACGRAAARARPILFSGSMVRAVLDSTKTQTRRPIGRLMEACPHGTIGELLWVRETWCQPDPLSRDVVYRADVPNARLVEERQLQREVGHGAYAPWRPSIHMPRWAARILLEITAVRLEHLQSINAAGALREGIEAPCILDKYERLWNSVYSRRARCSWADNPMVWVITFRRLVP